MSKLRTLLTRPDSGRTLLKIIGLVIAASAVLWLMDRWIGFDEDGLLGRALINAANSPWALPVTILVFTASSYVGAPQFLLIAIAVATFGPWQGFLYSYLGTLVSASANFYTARLLGARWFERRGGSTLKAFSELIGRNGFMTAMMVRIVPSAPFVVVNMGLGLTSTTYLAYIAGTAIGSLPKGAVVALLGKVVERARAGEATAIFYLGLAVFIWLALVVVARWAIRRRAKKRRRAQKALQAQNAENTQQAAVHRDRNFVMPAQS